MKEPEEDDAFESWHSDYVAVLDYVKSLLPSEIMLLPEVTSIIGADIEEHVDLLELVAELSEFIIRLKLLAPPIQSPTHTTPAGAFTSARKVVDWSDTSGSGPHSRSTSGAGSNLGKRRESHPTTRTTSRRTSVGDDASFGRNDRPDSPSFAPTDAQLAAWIKSGVNTHVVNICAGCGDPHHVTFNCNSTLIVDTEDPVNVRQEGKKLVYKDGVSFCYNYAFYAKCENGVCERLHLCTLCGERGGDHGPKYCLNYRRDHILACYLTWGPKIAGRTAHDGSVDPFDAPNDEEEEAATVREFSYKKTRDIYDKSGVRPNFGDYAGLAGANVASFDELEPGFDIPDDLDLDDLLDEFPGMEIRVPANVYGHLPKVEIRPDHKVRIELDDLTELVANTEVSEKLEKLLLDLCVKPTPAAYRRERARDLRRADELVQRLREIEANVIDDPDKPYTPAHFDLATHKVTDEQRYQTLDGSFAAARVHLLLHYPSPHTDSVVLTGSRFSTRLIIAHGVDAPTRLTDKRVAVLNTVPIMAAVQGKDGIRCMRQPGESEPQRWPSDAIAACINDRFELYKAAAGAGKPLLVTHFGSAESMKVLKKLKRALVEDFEIIGFEWRAPELAPWEMNIPCPQLSVLIDECSTRMDPFPSDRSRDELFQTHHRFQRDERDRTPNTAASRQARITSNPETVSVEFTFFSPRDDSKSGMLWVKSPHPEVANQDYHHPTVIQSLDMVIDFARRCYTGNLRSDVPDEPLFPCAEHFEWATKHRYGNDLKEQLETWINEQKRLSGDRLFSYESLPNVLRKHVDTVDLVPLIPGKTLVNPADYLARVTFARSSFGGTRSTETHGAVGSREGVHKTPAAEAQLKAARERGHAVAMNRSDTVRKATPAERYRSICLCGVESEATERLKESGKRFVQTTTKMAGPGSRHPANSIKNYGTCWTGIPLDDDQRQDIMVRTNRGVIEVDTDARAKMEAAVARFRSNEVQPVELTKTEWELLCKTRKTSKSNEKAARERAAAEAEASRGRLDVMFGDINRRGREATEPDDDDEFDGLYD